MSQEELCQAPVAIESADDDMRELDLEEAEEITGAAFEKVMVK